MSDLELSALHPQSFMMVVRDQTGRLGTVYGAKLQANWESGEIARFGSLAKPQDGWTRVRCPDDRFLFIKFLSPECRLLEDEPTNQSDIRTIETMLPAKKPVAPAKKGAQPKPVAAAPAAAKPAPAKPMPAKPVVKNPAAAKPAKEKPADAAPAAGVVDPKRQLKAQLKEADSATAIQLAREAGVVIDDQFLAEFMEAGVSGEYPWLRKRFVAALVARAQ